MAELFTKEFWEKLEYLRALARRVFRKEAMIKVRKIVPGAGSEFVEHRPYSSGDDFRSIDWSIYGRLGKLVIRLFEQDEELDIFFLLDSSRSMGVGDKFDYARKVAASLIYLALSNTDRVSVHPFGERIIASTTRRSGLGQTGSIFNFLEQIALGGGTSILEPVKELASKSGNRRGLVVLISDFLGQTDLKDALAFLRYNRFDVAGIQIVGEDDQSPSLSGDILIKDSETGESISASVDDSVINRYRKEFEEFRNEIEKLFLKNGANHVIAPVRIPFEELVQAVLRKGLFVPR